MTGTGTNITKRELLEQGLDALPSASGQAIIMSSGQGGLAFTDMMQVMEFSKMMAVAGQAVPSHCRGNPGICLALTCVAVGWRMDPFQVAQKSYVVNDRIGYESQLVHAVIESRAPLQKRLRCEYEGEGPTRTCRVWGTFVGEDEPHSYTSPAFKDIKVKNSPLWQADPDQQLFYYASRAWARRHAPDVLLGIYTRDELQEAAAAETQSSGLAGRVLGAGEADMSEGFRGGSHVNDELAMLAPNGQIPQGEVIDGKTGEVITDKEEPEQKKPAKGKPKKPAKASTKPVQAPEPEPDTDEGTEGDNAPTGSEETDEGEAEQEQEQTAPAQEQERRPAATEERKPAAAAKPKDEDWTPAYRLPHDIAPVLEKYFKVGAAKLNPKELFVVDALKHIDGYDGPAEDLGKWWDGLYTTRNDIAVPIDWRNATVEYMDMKTDELDQKYPPKNRK